MDISITCTIKQKNFQNGIFSFLETFRKQKHFLDVSLNCKDGDIQAHRVVLSLYSPLLYNTLKENVDSPSTVSLEEIPLEIVESLLKFMYEGEVDLNVSLIHDFLKFGEELEISGFPTNEKKENDNSSCNNTDAELAEVEGEHEQAVKKASILSVDEGIEYEAVGDARLLHHLYPSPYENSFIEDADGNSEKSINASIIAESPQFLNFQAEGSIME